MGYSVVNADELEPGGPGSPVRFVRRALGVEAFVSVGAHPGSYEPRGPF